ncbi:MAG: hypothetical protein ABJC04_13665, partial [Verrucomicrobiota bacterium]
MTARGDKNPVRYQAKSTLLLKDGFFSLLVGIFLALCLTKFANPVIFDDQVFAPSGFLEWIFQPWPTYFGYAFIALLVLTGLTMGKIRLDFRPASAFALLLPLIWLAWQFISATRTVDVTLTAATLKHFTACVVCFFLGWFCLGETRNLRPMHWGLLSGFVVVLWAGLDQHFGGLEETRRFFYAQPDWKNFPPEFIKKVSSNRIYSTLFYPNTLAAAMVLFLPMCLVAASTLCARRSIALRGTILAALAVGAGGCLFWSGSKT